jgi:plasmid stabilization system protein ParE
LILADPARDDLSRVRDHLTHRSAGPRATRRLHSLEAAITQLLAHPCRWPLSRHHQGVRKRSVEGGFVIIYEVSPDTGHDATAGDVIILAVIFPGEERTR